MQQIIELISSYRGVILQCLEFLSQFGIKIIRCFEAKIERRLSDGRYCVQQGHFMIIPTLQYILIKDCEGWRFSSCCSSWTDVMYLLCRNCPTHLCHKCPIPIVQLCLTFVFHMVNIDVPAGVGAPPLGKQLDKQLHGRLHAVLQVHGQSEFSFNFISNKQTHMTTLFREKNYLGWLTWGCGERHKIATKVKHHKVT